MRVKKIHREVSHRRRRLFFFSLIPASFGANYRSTILTPSVLFSNLRFTSSPDPSFQWPFSCKPFNKREREKKKRKSKRARKSKSEKLRLKKKSQTYTIPEVSSLKTRKAISVQFSIENSETKKNWVVMGNEMSRNDEVRLCESDFFFCLKEWKTVQQREIGEVDFKFRALVLFFEIRILGFGFLFYFYFIIFLGLCSCCSCSRHT